MTFEESKWYGILPDYWKTSKLKYVVQLNRAKASEKTNYIGLENIESFTARRVGEAIEPDGDAISFKPGDVLFGKLRPYLSKSLLVNESGCCSGEILVMSPTAIQAKYLLYMTLSTGFVNDVDMSTYGTKMPRANWEYIGNMKIPVPTLNEQHAIVAYLDEKCATIDESIQKRKEIIEKLQEYRKAVITRAVTKGLDPNVEMKDSSVLWIGAIPASWAENRLKFVATIVRGGSPRPIESYLTDGEGYNWIKIGDTTKGSKYITSTKQKILKSGLDKTRLVSKGTLLLTNSMSFGEPYILDINGCIHDGWLAFSDYNGIDKEYLYYYLMAESTYHQFVTSADGGVVQNLRIEKVSNAVVTYPSLLEQRQIVSYLDKKCGDIDQMLSKQQTIIDKLEEYKKSIIYNAVTGKIDCRPS